MVVFLICGFLLIAVALIGREWLLNQERRRLFDICDHLARDLADQRVHLDQYAQELHVLRQILMDSGTVSEEDLMRLHLQVIQQQGQVTLEPPAPEPARPMEQSVLPEAEVAKNRTLH